MFEELNAKLSALAEKDYVEDLFIYIKNNRAKTILEYNKTQLFKKSIGADGVALGFYKKSTEEINPFKEAGAPYEMFDTGTFKASLQIEVDVENREINIFSTDPKYTHDTFNELFNRVDPAMKDNSIFITNDFFGLDEFSMQHFLNRWIKPYLKQIMFKELN